MDEVGAQLLLEPRSNGDERGDPVGLFVLGSSDAGLVTVDEAPVGGWSGGLLGADGWGRDKGERNGKKNGRIEEPASRARKTVQCHDFNPIRFKITT